MTLQTHASAAPFKIRKQSAHFLLVLMQHEVPAQALHLRFTFFRMEHAPTNVKPHCCCMLVQMESRIVIMRSHAHANEKRIVVARSHKQKAASLLCTGKNGKPHCHRTLVRSHK